MFSVFIFENNVCLNGELRRWPSQKVLSLHSGAKKGGDPGGPLDGALKARGLGGGDLSLSSDSDSSQASANLGAQPMLWPAWVYCTRYSDRPSSGECAGLEGGAGAGLVGRKKTPGHSFPPTHTKTRTQRHCARLALRPGGWGAGRIVQGYILLTTEAADLSLSTFSEPPRTAPCPLPLAGVYLVGWGAQLEDRRASWLHDPLPGASNSVWSRGAARTPPNLDPSCDPEIPDAAWEERVRGRPRLGAGPALPRWSRGAGRGRRQRRPLPSPGSYLPSGAGERSPILCTRGLTEGGRRSRG